MTAKEYLKNYFEKPLHEKELKEYHIEHILIDISNNTNNPKIEITFLDILNKLQDKYNPDYYIIYYIYSNVPHYISGNNSGTDWFNTKLKKFSTKEEAKDWLDNSALFSSVKNKCKILGVKL